MGRLKTDDDTIIGHASNARWPTTEDPRFVKCREALRARVDAKFGTRTGSTLAYSELHRRFTIDVKRKVIINLNDGKGGSRTDGTLTTQHFLDPFQPIGPQLDTVLAVLTSGTISRVTTRED